MRKIYTILLMFSLFACSGGREIQRFDRIIELDYDGPVPVNRYFPGNICITKTYYQYVGECGETYQFPTFHGFKYLYEAR
jgi:hypothetical protein